MGEEYAASVDDDLKEELDLKSPCGENSEIKRKARGYNIKQMQDTDNSKYCTNQQLQPDHYNIGISKHAPPMALVYLECLPASLPCGEPSEADGEAQRNRGDDQITSGNFLSLVMGRKEGYHSDMSWVVFVLLSSGRDE
jgi:hypothetical protein